MNDTLSIPDLKTSLELLTERAKAASRPLARANHVVRSAAIAGMAELINKNREALEHENNKDMQEAKHSGLPAAMCDRLWLQGERLDNLIESVNSIAKLPDPVGSVTRSWTRENGLQISKMRLPLGVIMMIYEARPNVTIDAAALCIRSGNAVVLRGGSEARHTNVALSQLAQKALCDAGLPENCVELVPTQDRQAIDLLLTHTDTIDLVIPRGGEGLIRRVQANSKIPVVQHYKGVCHVFVEAQADLDKAVAIAVNAKVQRPGVCNAMETLLVDQTIASTFLPRVVRELREAQVQVLGCEQTQKLCADVQPATEDDFHTEFLALVLAIKVVDGLSGAVAHIDKFGSNHTASIVTEDSKAAETFVQQIDTSCVLVNASTRFNDGGELGLGAEMGISTTRIHAFGPMGIESLTAEKFVVRGNGQIRG